MARPKAENSVRQISIPQEAVELLIQEHAKHPSTPWLFPSSWIGGMYHPDSAATLHQRILKDAGLEHLRFHNLRHTLRHPGPPERRGHQNCVRYAGPLRKLLPNGVQVFLRIRKGLLLAAGVGHPAHQSLFLRQLLLAEVIAVQIALIIAR